MCVGGGRQGDNRVLTNHRTDGRRGGGGQGVLGNGTANLIFRSGCLFGEMPQYLFFSPPPPFGKGLLGKGRGKKRDRESSYGGENICTRLGGPEGGLRMVTILGNPPTHAPLSARPLPDAPASSRLALPAEGCSFLWLFGEECAQLGGGGKKSEFGEQVKRRQGRKAA